MRRRAPPGANRSPSVLQSRPLVGPEAASCCAASRWCALRAEHTLSCWPCVGPPLSGMARRALPLRFACACLTLAVLCSAEERLPGWQGERCVSRGVASPLPDAKSSHPQAQRDAAAAKRTFEQRDARAAVAGAAQLAPACVPSSWILQLLPAHALRVRYPFCFSQARGCIMASFRKRSASTSSSRHARPPPWRAHAHAHATRLRAAQARPELTKSSVVDNVSGKSVDSECVRRVDARPQLRVTEALARTASAQAPACSSAAARMRLSSAWRSALLRSRWCPQVRTHSAARHGGADVERVQTTVKASRSSTTRLGRNMRWALEAAACVRPLTLL